MLRKKLVHILKQVIEIFLDDAPHDAVIDVVISVGQYVSKGNDIAVTAYLAGN